MGTPVRTLAGGALVSLLLQTSAHGLEKIPAWGAELDEAAAWRSFATQTVRYYNTCTGWYWLWTHWQPEDRIAVVFDRTGGYLDVVSVAAARALPQGYGYTGTIAIHDVDAGGCPVDPPLASQPFIPITGTAFTPFYWGLPSPGGPWGAVVTFSTRPNNPIAFYSDHPAPGATGPIACGTCFPRDRTSHSFYLGPAEAPLCPGATFFDGFCDAELLWTAEIGYATDVEPTSWGSIKALYK